MTVTAGPTNVTVGDPITVRVQIFGRGALDSLNLPAAGGLARISKLIRPRQSGDQRPVRLSRHENVRANHLAAKCRRA